MRFIKLIVAVVILGLIALFVMQNIPTFNAEHSFKLSLYFGEPMVWTHSVLSLITIAGLVGLVVGILLMLKPLSSARGKLAQERRQAKA